MSNLGGYSYPKIQIKPKYFSFIHNCILLARQNKQYSKLTIVNEGLG